MSGGGASEKAEPPLVRLRIDLKNTPYEAATVRGSNGILERSAKLNSTWKEFLMNECGLELPVEGSGGYQGLFYVCSTRYVANSRSQANGWRAGLEERVGSIFGNYKRNRAVCNVRLMCGRGGGDGTPSQDPGAAAVSPAPLPMTMDRQGQAQRANFGDWRTPWTSISIPLASPEQTASSSGWSNKRDELFDRYLGDVADNAKRPRRDEKQSPPNFGESGSEIDPNDGRNPDGNDTWSDGTAADVERAELNAEGIQMENVIPRVKMNADRIDNALFLKAMKEIKDLRASGAWYKQLKRSPFVCIVMEELLKAPAAQGEQGVTRKDK